jgi:uncharacterized protein YoxC
VASDVLRICLAIFLIIVGIGLAVVFLRLGQLLARLTDTIKRVTEEAIVLLSKAETTMDGVNLELARTDEIMQSAVGATKAAERAAVSASKAVAVPARKLAGLAAGAREGLATFRARLAANRVAAAGDAPVAPPPAVATEPTPATSVGSGA